MSARPTFRQNATLPLEWPLQPQLAQLRRVVKVSTITEIPLFPEELVESCSRSHAIP